MRLMRNTLTLVLLAAGLCSCQKSIDGAAADENRPISVSPVTGIATKAPIAGTTFPDDRTMVLSAYYNAEEGTSANYFSKITFSKSGSTWGADKYWPMSGTLDLLAFSADGLTLSSTTYETKVTDGVTLGVPDNSSVQCDILWAYSADQKYEASGNAMAFNHAEASIAFTAKSNVAYDASSNKGITIESIVVKGTKNSGTVKLNNDMTCVWSDLGDEGDLTLPGISSGYNVPGTAIDLSTTPFGIGETGLIVPPQSATSFTITYTIHNGKDASSSNLDNTGLQFTYTCEGDWVYGKKYIYALNFTLNGITVAPSVVEWADGGTTEVDIPKKVVATYAMKASAGVEASLPKVKMTAPSKMGVDWGDDKTNSYKAETDTTITAKHTYASAYDGIVNITSNEESELEIQATPEEDAKLEIKDPAIVSSPIRTKILYTTESGSAINLDQYTPVASMIGAVYDGPTIESNTYTDGQGTIAFAESPTKIGIWMEDSTPHYCLLIPNDSSYGLANDVTSITLPNSVKIITGDHVPGLGGFGPFNGCDKLTEINLGNSLQVLGDYAISGCDALTTMTLPVTLTTIGKMCFAWCENLTEITFEGTKAQFNAITKGENWRGYIEVVHCSDGNIWLVEPYALKFSAEAEQTISLNNTGGNAPNVQYSYDGSTWNTWNYSALTFGTVEHPKVYVRGKNTSGFTSHSTQDSYFTFGNSTPVECSGNIMSLINYEDKNLLTIPNEHCFWRLFEKCNVLTTAPELPATTLAWNCYNGMFSGCTSLTTAPELPATTLTYGCYRSMFSGCTSLTTAPTLPATTLADACYGGMFSGCTSLTATPALPATVLTETCYRGMFSGCTSLTATPALPATTMKKFCYTDMFSGCTSLTTAPELPATTLAEYCYENMFSGCILLTTVPELPATTLAEYCYYDMFSGCTSLTTVPELSATTLADYCYKMMFSNCTSLTTSPELSATTLTEGCYREMFIGCSLLKSVTMKATDVSASQCLMDWLENAGTSATSPTLYVEHSMVSNPIISGQKGVFTVTSEKLAKLKSNKIFYTTSYNNTANPYKQDVFGANIVSNTYKDGQGVITFDEDVKLIGNEAFSSCSMNSITIPDSVKYIGKSAFKGTNITSITIPNFVTDIDGYAFSWCAGLTSVIIGDSVKNIGDAVFQGTKLESIIVNSGNSVFDSRNNCNAIINTTTNQLICGCKNTIIPNSVTSIGKFAFISSPIESITIHESVTSIGNGAFYYCTNLELTFLSITPPTIGEDVFDECKKIYVPSAALNAYKTAPGWSNYAGYITAIP